MTEARTTSIASDQDRAALIQTLSLAFQDDPALSWILPNAERRRQGLPFLFSMLVPLDMKNGVALCSLGNEVATLWRSPGHPHIGMMAMVMRVAPLLRAFGTALPRAMSVGDAIDAHHPKDIRYWYLHYAGVRPDHQGKGWGGAAIRAGIARADAEGLPVFLETATLANVGLYQSLGFQITAEWDVPKGGPHFWSMLRPVSSMD
jgi:ribosomal protein S18 acetylase RimI-like enzyme